MFHLAARVSIRDTFRGFVQDAETNVIGAEKCGTTWLWEMLNQYPGTDLPLIKELHFLVLLNFIERAIPELVTKKLPRARRTLVIIDIEGIE